MTTCNLEHIYKFITDIEICKNYDMICKHGYNHEYKKIRASLEDYNTFQVHQNIIDSLFILYFYDNKHGKDYFHKAIAYLLKNMVIHVGIDSWVKRKIYHTIVTLLPTYHNIKTTIDFINLFADAPSRIQFFIEFSIDSQVRKDLKGSIEKDKFPDELILIQNPSLSIGLEYRHFIEYLKENLGETYLLHLNDNMRNKFAEDAVNSAGKNQKIMINDILSNYHSSFLRSFQECFSTLITHLKQNNSIIEIKDSLALIMHDYCRIQYAQRVRTNLLYKDYSNMNMEDFDFYHHRFHMTDDYINFTILKHERILNEFRVKSFLDDLESLVDVFNDINYTNAISSNRKKLGKEVPPFPEMLRKRSAKAVLICFYF